MLSLVRAHPITASLSFSFDVRTDTDGRVFMHHSLNITSYSCSIVEDQSLASSAQWAQMKISKHNVVDRPRSNNWRSAANLNEHGIHAR